MSKNNDWQTGGFSAIHQGVVGRKDNSPWEAAAQDCLQSLVQIPLTICLLKDILGYLSLRGAYWILCSSYVAYMYIGETDRSIKNCHLLSMWTFKNWFVLISSSGVSVSDKSIDTVRWYKQISLLR